MKTKYWVFSLLLACYCATAVWALETRVGPGVGTLAASVANASDGDTLILEDGTFYGSVNVDKSLTIRPVSRSTNALVDGPVTINGSGITVTLQGLKFSGDVNLTRAAAIRLLENEWFSGDIEGKNYKSSEGDGSLVIVGNRMASGSRIREIYSDGAYIAGNILLGGSIETYAYVWIVGNEIWGIAPDIASRVIAIYATGAGSIAYIFANRVQCNDRRETYCIYVNSRSTLIASNVVEVSDTSLQWNYDSPQHGIVATGAGHATVMNNLVRGLPTATNRSGGSPIWVSTPSARVSGNIIIDYVSGPDTPGAITPINVVSATSLVTNNLCSHNSGDCPTGDGNLDADPLFVDLVDFELSPGSPAIDAGPQDYDLADMDRTRNDMGPQGGPWSIGQYDAQRDPHAFAPYVYPLFKLGSTFGGELLELQALGVARFH